MSQIRLNEKQKLAVEHEKGPLLIIAGAGTGKTSVITQRILHIIRKKWAKPSEILALTFTEKAAQEMGERIDMAMDYGYDEVWVSTFHAFCDRILRQEGHYIGLDTNYTLMTQAQSYIFMRKHLFDFPLETFRPQGNPTDFITDLIKHFSRLQDEDVSTEEYLDYAKKSKKQEDYELSQTYEIYTKLKIKESKIDFGDLIILTLKLFRERPELLKKYQEKFKYVLVDEFQDTNYTQNVLVNILVDQEGERNLTVVGDDDQAIYKFRGAAISNILQFKEQYPDAKEVVLVENYRSRQEILDASYSLITNNNPHRLECTEEIEKKLVASGVFENEDNDVVNLVVKGNDNEEAEFVAKEILQLVGEDGGVDRRDGTRFDGKGQSAFIDRVQDGVKYKFSDISILIRANSQSEVFIQTLRYYGIPYKLGGQRGLYFREEIKVLISFLRLLTDLKDSISMFEVLRIWGLTPREFLEVNRLSRYNKFSLFEEIEILLSEDREILEKDFSESSIGILEKLMGVIGRAVEMVKEGRSTGEILYMFVMEGGYIQGFLQEESSENTFKVSNISKFFDLIKEYEKGNPDGNVFEYVDYLNYSIAVGESPSVDKSDFDEFDGVNIMTVHGSKGLEFPVVFLVNLVSDKFPTRNRSDRIPIPDGLIKEEIVQQDPRESHISEERRLFYVGVTRAKERLYLTASNFYGNAKTRKKPSLFLKEVLDRDVTESFKDVDFKLKEGIEMYSKVENNDQNYPNIDTTKKVSYSQLNTYQDCPKKYEFAYVYKVPSKPNASLSFGSSIHNTLKAFYDLFKSSFEGLEGIVDIPTKNDLLDIYERSWISTGYESKAHEQKRKNSGIEVLNDYYDKLFSKDQKPYLLEESFSAQVGESIFVGKIDRIDDLGDGKYEIVDYKTGKVKDKKMIKSDLQLPLYAYFAQKKLGLNIVNAKYIFVEHGVSLDVDVSDERRAEALSQIMNNIEMIKSGDFSAKPSFGCKYCPYNFICEDALI